MRPWHFRALFYPAALGLLVYVVLGGGPPGSAKEPPYWALRGVTEQGREIKLHLDVGGRVRTFQLHADTYCTGGLVWSSGWNPSEGGAPARFAGRGPRLDAVETRRFERADGSVTTTGGVLHGRVSRSRASGTVQLTSRTRWPDGRRRECDSGAVRWTAD